MKLRTVGLIAAAGILTFACSRTRFKGAAKEGVSTSAKAVAAPPLPAPLPGPMPLPAPIPSTISTSTSTSTSTRTPGAETLELFLDCSQSESRNFVAKVYQLPEGTAKLPDFAQMTPLREVCLRQLDITERRFEDGFPGVGQLIEWFALDINFDVKIPADGDYTFRLNSDDGSRLSIDGKLLIDNDGQHGAVSKEATIRLTAGTHKFNVGYFQGPRFNIALELFYKPAAAVEGYLPLDIVSRPQ